MQQLNERLIVKGKILESDRSKLPKGVLCRGSWPVCNVGQLNHNGRMYEKAVWDKVLSDSQIKEKMEDRTLFGQAEHPSATQSDLQLTSHIITNTYLDESSNAVWQDIDVLDTPCGRIINTLLEADCKVGVSTRAEGDLEEAEDSKMGRYMRVIPESYHYITTDFTADPSTFGTKPENIEKNVVDTIKGELKNESLSDDEKRFATVLLESFQAKTKKEAAHKAKEGKKAVTKKNGIKEDGKEGEDWRYTSDEDIEKEFDGMTIESIEIKEPRHEDQDWVSGYIQLTFPEAGAHVAGGANEVTDRWMMLPDGKISFDNWYPEKVYYQLVGAIKDKIDEETGDSKPKTIESVIYDELKKAGILEKRQTPRIKVKTKEGKEHNGCLLKVEENIVSLVMDDNTEISIEDPSSFSVVMADGPGEDIMLPAPEEDLDSPDISKIPDEDELEAEMGDDEGIEDDDDEMDESKKDIKEQDEDFQEPDDEDIIISDTGALGGQTKVSVVGGEEIGVYTEWEDVKKAIKDYMDANNVHPNVWRESDHGNIIPVSLDESKEKKDKFVLSESTKKKLKEGKLNEDYSGWSNYDTWAVNMIVSNDEGLYHAMLNEVPFTSAEAEDFVMSVLDLPVGDDDFSWDNVNWDELADAWNDDYGMEESKLAKKYYDKLQEKAKSKYKKDYEKLPAHFQERVNDLVKKESQVVFENYSELVAWLEDVYGDSIDVGNKGKKLCESGNKVKKIPAMIREAKIKEAGIRAERDKAFDMVADLEKQVKESKTNIQERKILLRKIQKIKEQENKEVNSLRSLIERTGKQLKEAQKKAEKADRLAKDNSILEHRIGTLKEKHNKLKESVDSKIVKAYVNLLENTSGVALRKNNRALLEKCKTPEEVDEVFEDIREGIRIDALHQGRIDTIEESVQEQNNGKHEVVESIIGTAFDAMG